MISSFCGYDDLIDLPSLILCFISLFSLFFSVAESWKVPVLSKNLSEILASLSLNPNVATLPETYANIKDNHEQTVQEVRATLAPKIIALNVMIKNSA